MGRACRSAVHAGLRPAHQAQAAAGRVGGCRHAEPCRIPPAARAAGRLASLGRVDRAGCRLEQGRQLSAYSPFPWPRPRQRHAGRVDRHHGAAEQRAAPAGFRLGAVRGSRAPAGGGLSAFRLSRTAVLAGGRGTPRRLRGIGQPLRECLSPDAGLSAARGIPRPCGQAALRARAGRWRGLARSARCFRGGNGSGL